MTIVIKSPSSVFKCEVYTIESKFYNNLNRIMEIKKTKKKCLNKIRFNKIKSIQKQRTTMTRILYGVDKLIMPIVFEDNCVKLYTLNNNYWIL